MRSGFWPHRVIPAIPSDNGDLVDINNIVVVVTNQVLRKRVEADGEDGYYQGYHSKMSSFTSAQTSRTKN